MSRAKAGEEYILVRRSDLEKMAEIIEKLEKRLKSLGGETKDA